MFIQLISWIFFNFAFIFALILSFKIVFVSPTASVYEGFALICGLMV